MTNFPSDVTPHKTKWLNCPTLSIPKLIPRSSHLVSSKKILALYLCYGESWRVSRMCFIFKNMEAETLWGLLGPGHMEQQWEALEIYSRVPGHSFLSLCFTSTQGSHHCSHSLLLTSSVGWRCYSLASFSGLLPSVIQKSSSVSSFPHHPERSTLTQNG